MYKHTYFFRCNVYAQKYTNFLLQKDEGMETEKILGKELSFMSDNEKLEDAIYFGHPTKVLIKCIIIVLHAVPNCVILK